MRRRLPLPILALAAVVSLAASCLSPTIPLPPPEVPDVIKVGAVEGTWEVFGTCTKGAIVTVFNEKTGMGVIFEDRAQSGSYHVTIAGEQCDLAHVEEELGNDHSTSTNFVLAPHKPGDPTDNPLCH